MTKTDREIKVGLAKYFRRRYSGDEIQYRIYGKTLTSKTKNVTKTFKLSEYNNFLRQLRKQFGKK